MRRNTPIGSGFIHAVTLLTGALTKTNPGGVVGMAALETRKKIHSLLQIFVRYLSVILVIMVLPLTVVQTANAAGEVSSLWCKTYPTCPPANGFTDADQACWSLAIEHSFIHLGRVGNECYLDEPVEDDFYWIYYLGRTCPSHSSSSGTDVCTCDSGYTSAANACVSVPPEPLPPEPLPDQAENNGEPDPNSCQGNPCDAGTGNKYQHETDYVGAGPHPLILERRYNSGGIAPASVELSTWGSRWRGTYDRGIALDTSVNIAVVKREDGKQIKFYGLSDGSFRAQADTVGTLVRLSDGGGQTTGWTYTNNRDEIENYDAAGKLISITNRLSQTQTLAYSDGTAGANGGYVLDAYGAPTAVILPAGRLIRISDLWGRTLQFGYDEAGRVVKMTDPAGGEYIYAYSGPLVTDNLNSVTYPDNKVRTYLYGEAANVSVTPDPGVDYAHSLTGILNANGSRYASWTYDAQGRATSSEHGAFGSGIDKVTLVYTAPDANGNSTTTVTDPRGNERIYSFSTVLGVVKSTGITGQPCAGCSAALTYDANGNVTGRTDFKGNTICYAYDLTRNLETVRLEGLPPGTACPADLAAYTPSTAPGSIERKITTAWHSTLRVPTRITEPTRIIKYWYTDLGLPYHKSIQDLDTWNWIGAQIWQYTYNANGQVLTANGPRIDVDDITRYEYDAVTGNLLTVKNALNQVTTLGSYDAHGRPHTITDPNDRITSLGYDARGRLTSLSTGEAPGYTYEYDGVGQLKIVTTPAGAVYTFTYDDAHRLTDITDSLGNYIHYTLDATGNRTLEQIFAIQPDSTFVQTQTHSREFDALNRLWKDIGAVNQTTVYEYDANGNLIGITDPLNRSTIGQYDALNRLSQVTNADNGIVKYNYDGQDQLITVTDPRNLITRYTRDAWGNIHQQTSPDSGNTTNTYDEAGNLKTRLDGKGQLATYTYDALNRLTGISYTGGAAPAQTVSYQYDQGANGIGHLTRIEDATGATDFSYDLHGRLIGETKVIQGATYTTGYRYDAQGRMDQISYPSGRTVNYSFDGIGRISQVATTFLDTTTILASNIAYEPFGGLHSFTYGDGQTAPVQTYTRQRDQDGRTASYSLNGTTMSIGYDVASQISTITDMQSLNIANYYYDSMSRLNSFTLGTASQSFNYDTVGNRTSQTIGATTTTYGYEPTSNRLTSIQTGGGAPQSVFQDAIGGTTSDPTRQYAYDIRGRLIQTTTAQGTINYQVNALGLRVRKQVPYASTDTVYHYDAQGHLIAESQTGTHDFVKEYIYLGDQPVAVMQ